MTKQRLEAEAAAVATATASQQLAPTKAPTPAPAASAGAHMDARKRRQREDNPAAQTLGDASTSNCSAADATDAASGRVPCSDQGHWGDDGEWVYPAEISITCSSCNSNFAFTGEQQAWYAARKLFAPARCATCLANKKMRREEKQASGRSGINRCFNCGEYGHGSAQCSKPKVTLEADERKACYVCGSTEHLSRNCPNVTGKKKSIGCFTCGSESHLSRECPQKPTVVCHNCGGVGHASKSCDQPVRSSGVCFAFKAGQCFRKKCPFEHS